jgi:hypothetical protein
MYTPRINWFLFVLYLLGAIGVLTASLFVPNFRSVAYAPLRELILPPPSPVVVSVLYSTEKEAWLNDVIVQFEKTNPKIDGHPVKVELEKMGSWEINAAVLDDTRKPVIVFHLPLHCYHAAGACGLEGKSGCALGKPAGKIVMEGPAQRAHQSTRLGGLQSSRVGLCEIWSH